MSSARTAIDALQAALEGEHAAIYGFGVVGAHLSGAEQAKAEQAWDTHRMQRDRLRAVLRDRGATPIPAAAGYELPLRVHDRKDAIRLAGLLEDRLTSTYLSAVAVRDEKVRYLAAAAVQQSALRAARWRGSSEPFPGLPRSRLTH
jgi:hypothetical protein